MPNYSTIINSCSQSVDFWSINILQEESEEITVRKSILQPINMSFDKGALITVIKNGSISYASTQDLSENGIKNAFLQAYFFADKFSNYSLHKNIKVPFAHHQDSYSYEQEKSLLKVDLEEKIDFLKKADKGLLSSQFIIDAESSLWSILAHSQYINSLGSNITQDYMYVMPSLSATANKDNITQIRTLGGMRAYCQQGGLETILGINLEEKAYDIAKDATNLLSAINCPDEKMDVLIDPDQMMLQIHESIGHPLELDRILGDERNYAGTSFVTLDMFGSYQYGSNLLNITFDPTIPKQFASYAYDDEGSKACKEFVIKDGLLVKPLGAALSQARANMPGVANARSSSWNRPPIDRMANLNLEPGVSSFDEMLSSIKRGIYLKSNSSWSIDDSRNKFQFGCEWGQLIENGKLTKLVRNPNYRGISANFWRNLAMVGDKTTFAVMGTPFCGKGEPNQVVRVGHASPVCLFSNVDVFGGE